MHVLVVSDSQRERALVSRALQASVRQVETANTLQAGAASLRAKVAQVVVLAWALEGAAQFVRFARQLRAPQRPYVIALLGDDPPALIPSVMAAGADDFLRNPLSPEEVVARVRTPLRVREWSGSPIALDWSAPPRLDQLRAFRELGSIAAGDLEQLLGEPLQVTEGWFGEREIASVRGASVPMTLARDGVELRVAVMVPSCTRKTLAGIVLGDPNSPAAAAEDMMRELANLAGGAVKRASLAEAVELTTGLPVNEERPTAVGPQARRWIASARNGNLEIGIAAEVRQRTNVRVRSGELREGMILVHDLRNESGALLVPGGTRLTQSTAGRVGAVLGAGVVIEVVGA